MPLNVTPSHCLACQQELLPDTERPERFCSNQCLLSAYTGQPRLEQEPRPDELHEPRQREQRVTVLAELEAALAVRLVTGTAWREEDLTGLRWLATWDPAAAALVAELEQKGVMPSPTLN